MSVANRMICRPCVDCGEEFTISPKFQDYLRENGLKLPKRCASCRAARKSIAVTKTCVDCGKEFGLTTNELNYYSQRGLSEPKRCEDCRAKRRRNDGQRSAEAAEQE